MDALAFRRRSFLFLTNLESDQLFIVTSSLLRVTAAGDPGIRQCRKTRKEDISMNQLKTVSQSQAADQKENTALQEAVQREKTIIRTSVIGILANVVLAAFKGVIGVLSGSIAIFLDAVNNITDAGSSLVTIIGTKLAAMQPNRKHPFGYGRIEYLSAMIIAAIVLDAGIFLLCGIRQKDPESGDVGLQHALAADPGAQRS